MVWLWQPNQLKRYVYIQCMTKLNIFDMEKKEIVNYIHINVEREPSNRLKVIGKYPYDWEFFEYQCIVDVSKVIYQTVIHL